jgi:hypothetical protein
VRLHHVGLVGPYQGTKVAKRARAHPYTGQHPPAVAKKSARRLEDDVEHVTAYHPDML